MEEWFHDSRPKDEIHCAGNAIEAVIKSIQLYFPRGKDSHGYNIPKMHGLTKMRDYICEFGSAMNFYGGPGEASHKTFVKALGLKTQRRVKEFLTQTAGRYYNIMALNKAFKYLDMRSKPEGLDDISFQTNCGDKKPYLVQGEYTIEYLREGIWKTISKNKFVENYGLDQTLLQVLERTNSFCARM